MIIEEQLITIVKDKVFLDWVESNDLIVDKEGFKDSLISDKIYLFSIFVMEGKFEMFFYNKDTKGSSIFSRDLKSESITFRNEEHNTLYDEMNSRKSANDPEALAYNLIKIKYEEAMEISKESADKGMPLIGQPIVSIQVLLGVIVFDVILFQQNFEVVITKINSVTKEVIERKKNKFGIQDIVPGNDSKKDVAKKLKKAIDEKTKE